MSGPFPFPTRYLDEVDPPGGVHPTEFTSLTDPALVADNHVRAGKRWRQPDNLTTPTKYRIYVRNAANSAWILEGSWGIATYAPGQVPAADADGYLWPADVEGGESGGVSDHGGLTGLADDDHTQYLPADGSRPLTADMDADGFTIENLVDPVSDQQAATKKYVDDNVGGGGGSLILIERKVASASASLDFVTGIDDTYDQYELHFGDIVPQTDDAKLNLTVSTDGGSSWASSGYRYNMLRDRSDAGGAEDASAAAAVIQLSGYGAGNATGESMNGRIICHNLRGALYKAFRVTVTQWQTAGDLGFSQGGGGYASATAVNGLRLIMSTGNITSGWAALYGVKKA